MGLKVSTTIIGVFATLTFALTQNDKFPPRSNNDPVKGRRLSETFYKKLYTYKPYIDIFRNFTHQDMKSWADDIMSWDVPAELKEKFPYIISGYDFEDRPILIAELGRYNIQEMVEKGQRGMENMEKYLLKAALNLLLCTIPNDPSRKDVRQIAAIMDLEDYKYIQAIHVPTLNFARRMLARYIPFLNIAVAKVVVLNANYVGETGFQLMRPFIGQLLERVELYGTRRVQWAPNLLRMFPQESIPPKYGGSKYFQPLMSFP